MRTKSLLWSSLVLILMISGATAATAANAAANAVTTAEYQWLKALQTNKADLIAPVLAEKVVYTDSENNVYSGKAAVIAAFKTDTYKSADYQDFKVTQFGGTAIATGIFIGKVVHAGKARDVRVRFTDTWIRAGKGKWLCVATQD